MFSRKEELSVIPATQLKDCVGREGREGGRKEGKERERKKKKGRRKGGREEGNKDLKLSPKLQMTSLPL